MQSLSSYREETELGQATIHSITREDCDFFIHVHHGIQQLRKGKWVKKHMSFLRNNTRPHTSALTTQHYSNRRMRATTSFTLLPSITPSSKELLQSQIFTDPGTLQDTVYELCHTIPKYWCMCHRYVYLLVNLN